MSKSYTIYDPLANAYREVAMTEEQIELYYASAQKVKGEKDNERTDTSNS
jgi:hypothetical protein